MNKFKYAFNGLILGLKDRSILIQFILGLIALIGGFIFKISMSEWFIFIILIGMVIAAEIFNTCIEALCDLIDNNHNDEIARIKDMAAGAVLILAIAAFVIAGLIILF